MKKEKIFFYLSLLLFVHGFSFAEEFSLTAGLNAPYFIQYSKKENATGVAVEIITGALRAENISYTVEKSNWPWKRALDTFNEEKNTVGFLTKTIEREKGYRWVAPILSDDLYVFTFGDHPAIENLDELKLKKSVGALAGSGSESILTTSGLKDQSTQCKDDKQCLELLAEGRLDAWVASKYKSNYRIEELNMKGKVKRGMTILNTDIWMITSLKTDDASFAKLKNAIDKFKSSKEYSDIIKKYE